jgi:isoleucyl-tRNA synthetase
MPGTSPAPRRASSGNDYDPEQYEQVFDILDVWFDSGSTHAFVLRDRPDGTEDGIADVYMEGTDQHRGWFHSSLLQACGTIGRAPYRNVVTHGFTLDEKGMKMSKSIGNTVAPQEVVNQYGADILRLWVAQADYTADQRIGPEILKGTADSYRRLRNTMRFMLGSLSDFTEADRVDPADMPELERWVLHRLAELDRGARGLSRPSTSRACSRRCSSSPPRTCRPSISTSARTRSIATATPIGGARRGRCWTSCSTG